MKNKIIKIGITGHRDLKKSCVEFYSTQLNKQLKNLKQKYNNIVVLSSIADGADRLIIYEAIKLDISYRVILPMEQLIYMKDFTKTSKKEFMRLIQKAQSLFTVPLQKNTTLEQINKYNQYRDIQYKASGHYISDNCDILITLWDGKYNGLIGGTGEIIKYHLTKQDSMLYILYVSRNKDVTNTMVKFKVYENSS